jgi:hypothetical protein
VSVRADTVAALAEVLSPAERAALLWAAQLGAGLSDADVPGADPEATRAVGRTLRTLLPALAQAVVDRHERPDPAGDCTSCGSTIDACDHKIEDERRACCLSCSLRDTHGDPVGGYAARRRARAAAEARPNRDELLAGVVRTIGIGTGDTGQYLGVKRADAEPYEVTGYCVVDERAAQRIDLAHPAALARHLTEEIHAADRARVAELAAERRDLKGDPT